MVSKACIKQVLSLNPNLKFCISLQVYINQPTYESASDQTLRLFQVVYERRHKHEEQQLETVLQCRNHKVGARRLFRKVFNHIPTTRRHKPAQNNLIFMALNLKFHKTTFWVDTQIIILY